MTGRVLQQYLQPKTVPAETVDAAEANGPDDLGAFGLLRGTHERALMLEVREKNGTITAYPYAWLSKGTFDPSEGITLRFGADTVKIIGRNLNAEVRPNVRLFQALVRHRVPWIQEADEPASLKASPETIVIEQVTIKS